MSTATAVPDGRPSARPGPLTRLAPVALAVGAGLLVALASVLGPARQAAVLLLLALTPPVLLLFLFRPHLSLAAYLLAIPLILPVPVAGGLNAGEAATLGMLVLGFLGLWRVRERIGPALRALAPVLVPLVVLSVVSIVSLLVNGILAFEEIVSALFKVLTFGLIALLVHVYADTDGHARTLLRAMALGATAVAAYSVLAWLAGWSYDATYDWNRASGTFENWNLLGGFMALMALPTLALAARSRGIGARIGWATGFLLQIVALLLSLTLGSMAGVVVGALFTVVFVARIGWRRLLPAALLAILAFGFVFATNPALRDKLARVDERVEDRLLTYAVGINMFADRFWWGFGSEQNLTDELWFGEADYGITGLGTSSMVPHNAFLKIGVEKGFFGAAVFTLLIVGCFVLVFRQGRRLRGGPDALLYYGIVAGAVAFMTQNMTNDLMLHARVGIVFFALISVLDRLGRAEAGRAGEGTALAAGADG